MKGNYIASVVNNDNFQKRNIGSSKHIRKKSSKSP